MTEIQLPSQQQRADSVSQATRVEQARAVAEVAAAVRVAQDYRRDEDRAYAQMRRACQSHRLAERAFYAVQNRGNGPSVHLARELARIWGNNDYGVREMRRDDEGGVSEILAFAWDQETNMRSSRSFIVPHARMARGSRQKLTDLQDIYLNNQNIGARAVRECIFSVLPTAFVEEAQELCHATLTAAQQSTGVPIEEQRRQAVAAYTGAGVTVGQLEARFGPVASWTPEVLASTHVLWTSLQRNEITLAEAFEPAAPGAAGGRVTADEITQQAQQRAQQPDPQVQAAVAKTVEHAEKAQQTGAPEPATAPPVDRPPVAPPVEQTPDPGQVQPVPLNPRGALARRMFGLFNDAGIPERADRLKYASDVVKRDVTTSGDLTEADAHTIIDALESDLEAQREGAGTDRRDPDPGGESDAGDPALDDPTMSPDWGARG